MKLLPSVLFTLFLSANSLAFADSVKVAFTGDQGNGSHAESVLRLIKNEGTDLLLIQGDLGYSVKAAAQWNSHLVNTLGDNFPVLAVVGNHENFEWPLYKSYIQNRINRNSKLDCSGDTGVKSLCQFENIEIVQVAQGVTEVNGVLPDDGYADYIRSSFASPTDRWRICAWHKNQKNLQTGNKSNATGWDIYRACLDVGAMVAVAHEHAYSRSYLLSDFENQTVVHRNSDMTLKPGQSFVTVSGLGGREVRPQVRSGDWWASVYTSTQNASHGALFCTFESTTADCYFKSIKGDIPDRFTLKREAGAPSAGGQTGTPASTESGYVFSRTDKEEFRWIANAPNGGLGNIWIDSECAQKLGGPAEYGRWSDLDSLAPAHDSIANPCATESDNPPPVQVSTQAGYVFSRTDKEEFRWIDRDLSGRMGNVWIDQACANSIGGPSASGDWGDLDDLAPGHDTIANPCASNAVVSVSSGESNSSEGYVFSRTDKDELRWIDINQTGAMGNTWIDAECAAKMGGPSAFGGWSELISQAPAMDTVAYPCQ